MGAKLLPKGGIYEVNFGCRPKMGSYTTLMSYMVKFCAMPCRNEERGK